MKMRILAAALITAATASTALADDDDRRCGNVPLKSWMSEDAARSRAADLGIKVRKVEIDDGCYEVSGRDGTGRRIEMRMHPQSGDQVSIDGDDD